MCNSGMCKFPHLWISVNNPKEPSTAFIERNKNISTRANFTTTERGERRERERDRKRDRERNRHTETEKEEKRLVVIIKIP